MTKPFIHHVYFWLKNPNDAADKAALLAGLEKLSIVETIHQYFIGAPAPTDRPVIDSSYSVSWLLIFATAEDEAVYQTHPLHLEFIDSCKHLWERVVVYDSI